MATAPEQQTTPSIPANRDDRKTAGIFKKHGEQLDKRARPVTDFKGVRELLRNPKYKQAMIGEEYFDTSDPEKAPVAFLDGEAHRKKRVLIGRYFAPKVITTRYKRLIDQVIAEHMAELRRK